MMDTTESYSRPAIATCFTFSVLFFMLFSNSLFAQKDSVNHYNLTLEDSTQVEALLSKILEESNCDFSLSASSSVRQMLYSYHIPPRDTFHHYSPPHGPDTIWIHDTITIQDTLTLQDTLTIVKTEIDSFFMDSSTHRVDTFYADTPQARIDTFYPPTTVVATPQQEDMQAAKDILVQIRQDQQLSAQIEEVVRDMDASDMHRFQQDLEESLQRLHDELKEKERAERLAAREARKTARDKRRADWKKLSKEEKREIVKEEIAAIAEEAGSKVKDGALVIGAGAAASVAVVTAVVVGGVYAIGKGIINAVSDIWNWIDAHFYVRVDLSCAEQRRIRRRRLYVAAVNKQRPLEFYKGGCPGW